MRAQGVKLSIIGSTFGVSTERVRQVCVGIKCPIDHMALAKIDFLDPAWRKANLYRREKRVIGHADFIRAHYRKSLSASEIGNYLGITKGAVIGRARDLGLCVPTGNVNTAYTKNIGEE